MTPDTRLDTPWHARAAEDVLRELGSSPEGLPRAEAARRLDENGPNELSETKGPGVMALFGRQLASPLILMLLGAAALSLFAQHAVDAAVIVAVVVLNTVIGVSQEWRAERALEALRQLTAPRATVLRDGAPVEIEARELVAGDVVLAETGDSIAADLRLFACTDLTVDESALTGESEPVQKSLAELPEQTPLADRTNMAWASTAVTGGRGRGVVVATGMDSVIGQIAGEVQSAGREQTPLQRRLARLGLYLGIIAVVSAVAIFVFGLLRGFDLVEMLLFAVAAAVSAIPEGLPAVISVVLAVGVQRMSRRNAILRRLPAVETLGSTTVVCTDKTGTITRNQMTVRRLWTTGGEYAVEGDGFSPEGAILAPDGTRADAATDGTLRSLAATGVAVNNAHLVEEDGSWKAVGNPTDAALIVAGRKAGIAAETLPPRLAEIPFSSTHKYAAALADEPDGVRLRVKGAPERLLAASTHALVDGEVRALTDGLRAEIHAANDRLAAQALRVVAAAYREMPAGTRAVGREEAEHDLVFLGLWGLLDPAREDAVEAIGAAQAAGVRVVMITGDHATTASAIARQAGIVQHGEDTVTGEQLDAMSDDELRARVESIAVYARVAPEHKFRIVEALKSRGHVVAMTGDGVNDAPALKAADIGIAMGRTGTEVAKEAADMVLGDDNFATIVTAIEEGRVIFANLRRVVAFLLTTTSAEVLTLFAALALGLHLPLTAVMILWVNLVTDGVTTIPLGLEPKHDDVLTRPPRPAREGVITTRVLTRIAALAVITATGTLVLFGIEAGNGGELEHARTVAFTTLVAFEWFKSLTWRTSNHSLFSVGLFTNKWITAALAIAIPLQLAAVYTPLGRLAFGTRPLDLADWLRILAVASSVLIFDEIGKAIVRRR